MGTVTFKYDDDDDYGTPKLEIPVRTRLQRLRLKYHQYRSLVLVIAALVFLLYWIRGREYDPTDWSRVAYVQYATDTHSLCNSLLIFETLKRLGSRADRVLLHPEEWHADPKDPDRDSQLLWRAMKDYGVRLKPTQLLGYDGPVDPGTLKNPSVYETSVSKLRIFELNEYDKVIYFDSDSTLFQHMDELFSLPRTAIAMPRAYWSDSPRAQWPLSSALMVIEPNAAETKHIWETLQWWRLSPERSDSRHYDNDLLNDRFGSSALVLPHRPYFMQSSEFREQDHSAWLGSYGAPASYSKWDAAAALKEVKLIHFSDWPLPKPWVMWPIAGLAEVQPDCGGVHIGTCDEREIWKGLYDDFRRRRKDICKILSIPAPQNWEKYKNETGAT
ncbi:hypothetical protein LTR37_001100 [Vermiconidia calcicola]|uniref:Uncharacterized protein n=1 Tax=Vermiconidia calcicola TaxID=1690605 RepID=A0ACC3NX33_9PEZI|nr:hypothetical protein LTR37_001100 [Vermiconidia calcicola]